MTQKDKLYQYLKMTYAENEPIFLGDLSVTGIPNVSIRQAILQFTKEDLLRRYDNGIYYIPKQSAFKNVPSFEDIINYKYLIDGQKQCGYYTGILFANKLGLTTQVPMVYEIATNKATTDYREVLLSGLKIIIRKPKATINDNNYKTLQFLDLMREIDFISEVEGEELTKKLSVYMKNMGITFKEMDKYLPLYPDKIYKNMYESRLVKGIF